MHRRLVVNGDLLRADLGDLSDEPIVVLHHEVHVERDLRLRAQVRERAEPHRHVRREVRVHDVEVEPVDADFGEQGDFFGERRLVGAHERRSDLHGPRGGVWRHIGSRSRWVISRTRARSGKLESIPRARREIYALAFIVAKTLSGVHLRDRQEFTQAITHSSDHAVTPSRRFLNSLISPFVDES